MRRVRTWMIWLLMLALPFQGYAAASMFACMTENTAVAADAMTPMSAVPDEAVHAHHDGSHDSVSAPSAGDTPSASSPDVDHGCSLCNLCSACHAAAIVDTALLPAEPHLPQADLIEPRAITLAAPGRPLEKPPRA